MNDVTGADDSPSADALEAQKRFLAAALLLIVARGDGDISEVESGRMVDLLVEHMGMRYPQALEVLTRVLNLLRDEEDVLPHLRTVAERLAAQEKSEMLTMVLEVAAADGVRQAGEEAAIEWISRVLSMSQSDIQKAYRDFFERE